MARDASALRVLGLSRGYGGRAAVTGLSLDVRPGDLYGFLGPNGAGKTTAIRCILGLLRPDAGEVRIFGESDAVRRRSAVGAMVETPAFHEWRTARQNLELACAYAGAGGAPDIEEALERVGLRERAAERVGAYSLGMKQRLGIARALVSRPRLLILDEPTNGLDPRGMREVRDLLRELVRRDGLTVFVSSHLLAEVQVMCNRVGILDAGVLRQEGLVSELLAAPTELRQVEVGVDDRALAEALLAPAPGVTLAGEAPEGRLLVTLEAGDAADLNALLVRGGVRVHALLPRQGTLEDVYLAATQGPADAPAERRSP